MMEQSKASFEARITCVDPNSETKPSAAAPAVKGKSRRPGNWWTSHIILAAGLSCWLVFMALGVHSSILLWQPRVVLLESASQGSPQQDAHKPWSWDARNMAALVLSLVVGALANAAGVGGGAFFVPLFNILLDFSLKGSTALSQAVITGGACASVAYSLTKRHPVDPAKPLIDFDMALMLTPVLLLGVSAGVLLNVLFPDWLLTFMLTALLLWLTWRIVNKGYALHQAERRAAAAGKAAAAGQLPPDDAPPSSPTGSGRGEAADVESGERKANAAAHAVSMKSSSVSAPDPHQSAAAGAADSIKALHGPGGSSDLDSTTSRSGPAAAAAAEGGEGGSGGQSSSSSALRPAAAGQRRRSSQQSDDHHWGEDGSVVAGRIGGGMARTIPPPDGIQTAGPSGISDASPRAGDRADAHHGSADHDAGGGRQKRLGWQLAKVVALWGFFLTLQLVKSKFHRCSPPYYAIYSAQVVLSFAASGYFVGEAHAARQRDAANALRVPMLRSLYGEEPEWTVAMMLRACFVTLVGGSIAGMLGIGGGMIVSPLLLELGVHPLVAAATSSLMVLFSASSAALSFAFDHLLNITYGLVYAAGCFAAALGGVLLVARAVRASGKASIVVMILALVIGTGAVLTGVFGGKTAIDALISGTGIGFHSFCSS